MPVTHRAAVRHFVAVGVIGGLAAIQMSGWLNPDLLPLFDFPGYVAVAEDVRNQILASGYLSEWSVSWFGGTSRFTSHFKEFLSLPLVIALGALRGTQLTIFILKVAAGLSLYGAFERYLKAPAIGIVAGSAYACSMSASYSTQNSDAILSLLLFPLIFVASVEMYRKRSHVAAICLGTLMACQLATNMVHAIIAALIPILLGLFRPWRLDEGDDNPLSDWHLASIWLRRAMLASTVFACLAASQVAWFLWDQQHHASHDPSYIEKVVSAFSEPTPLLLLNRANWMGSWLNEHRTPFQETFRTNSVYGQHHYLGVVALLILLLGWFRARETLCLRRSYQLFGLLFVIQWGLAIGPHSLLWQIARTFSWPGRVEELIGLLLVLGALLSLGAAIRQWRIGGGQITRAVENRFVLMLVLAFIPSSLFLLLQHSSRLFDHFRAPGQFMVLLPFAFYPAMGIGLFALVRSMPRGWLRQGLPVIVLALIVVDTWPVRSIFQHDHSLAPVLDFRERVAALPNRTATNQPEGRLGIWPFTSPSLWTEPSWIATASSLDGAWGWLQWHAGEYYSPFYRAAFRGYKQDLPEAARREAQKIGNVLSQIARVRYLISELDGPSTARLGSPWQSLARNERFELWRQPEISPVAAGYRAHLIAGGTATWPMLATIARSHEKGLLVLMADGKGNLPGDDLREAAGLSLLFSPDSIATEKVVGNDSGQIKPGDSLLIDSKQSRGMLQRFLREHPRLATVPVSYSRPSSEEIELEIDAGDEPAIVFISEGFHPGWHAYLDGESGETPLLRAQMAFMAVPVPDGRHAIRLRFEPPRAVRVAETISAVCWLALPTAGIGWAITVRRRPRIDS